MERRMRLVIGCALALAAGPLSAQIRIGAGEPAKPAAAPPAPPATTCSILASTYEGASMDLAANRAEGVGDNSAPRATLRAMEDANTLAEARITLDLMRDHKCALPKSAPTSIFYLSDALSCATDRLKSQGAGSPPSCDRSKWKRLGR